MCRGSFVIEESVTPKSPAVHPMSPGANALPPSHAQSRQAEIQRNPSGVGAYPVSPRVGSDAAHFVQTAAGQISIEALQPTLSNVSTEASAEYVKLKEENQSLADK